MKYFCEECRQEILVIPDPRAENPRFTGQTENIVSICQCLQERLQRLEVLEDTEQTNQHLRQILAVIRDVLIEIEEDVQNGFSITYKTDYIKRLIENNS